MSELVFKYHSLHIHLSQKNFLETTAASASSAHSIKAAGTRSPLEHLPVYLCPQGSLEKEGVSPCFQHQLDSWVCL